MHERFICDVDKLTNISFNLANVGTAGFKKQVMVTHSFAEMMHLSRTNALEAENDISRSVSIPNSSMVTDQSIGPIKYTGDALNLFAEGNRFFTVLTGQGVGYTKQGSFKLDPNGVLVNASGHPVLGQTGEIRF